MSPGMPSSTSSPRPDWWSRHRIGLFVHMSADSVPAWAPIGRPADRYRLDHDGADTSDPLVETLAHHRDRWQHVTDHADFVGLLTFDAFDADEWTALARDTGAGSLVVTARDRYGLNWFDTPGVSRTGPDVLARLATACERDDLVLGASYWIGTDDGRTSPRDLGILVDEFGVRRLSGGDPGSVRRPRHELFGDRSGPELVVDDRLVDDPDALRVVDRCPRVPQDEPWELRIPIGGGPAFNRAEREEHLATPAQLVSDLTEAIAKGGRALLMLGADAQGRLPSTHAERCRAVGGWLRRHRDLVDRGEPWQRWGDDHTRHLVLDDVLHVIDVSGRGVFTALDRQVGRIDRIETLDGAPIGYVQDERGVRLERPPRKEHRLPQVYRVGIGPPPEPPIRLFDEPEATTIEFGPLVASATRGTIVQLGDAVHVGSACVPSGVTVRGLGPDRTVIRVGAGDAVHLLSGARLEHCTVVAAGRDVPGSAIVVAEGDAAVVVGCSVAGTVRVTGSHVRIVSVTATAIRSDGADHVSVVRGSFVVPSDDEFTAIEINGGVGHLIDSCRIGAAPTGVRITRSVGAVVRGNRFRSRWTGVHLVDCEDTAILANSFERVVRAVDISGGSGAAVSGNLATAGDSGAVVRNGATDCTVTGNRWEHTRIGLLTWGAGVVHHHDNDCIDLGDPDGTIVSGP